MATPREKSDDHGRTARLVATIVVAVLLGATGLHLLFLPSGEGEEGADPAADEHPTSRFTPTDRAVITPVQFSANEVLAETTAAERANLEAIRVASNPLDAARAYGYLKQLCDLGPRPSGSDAMRRQQELLVDHFESHGAGVELQHFKAKNPLGGPRMDLTNVVASWNTEATERVLLCAHYDTRPLPDRDPNPVARRRGRFLGANDGASGTAVLMELAHHLSDYEGAWGVDLVLFDAEEYVFQDGRDPYFLGSRYFAERYKKRRPKAWSYRWAILLDMVGDADLQLYFEKHSYNHRETRPLVIELWATAARLGLEEFVPRTKHEVLDDHLALRRFGGIPAIDIIDFDYPYWHTEADSPRNCSGESLAKVGWVVWEWLQAAGPAQPREDQP